MMQSEKNKILVIGATGTVGGATARELVRQGGSVRALVRSKESAGHLSGVELVVGDLRNTASFPSLFAGIHTAFYVSPHEADEVELAENFIGACEKHAVRLVFVGVHVDAPTRLLRNLVRFYFGRLMPAYIPKLRISERARTSRANPIVLMPTNFFENDEIFREELLEGTFLQPFDRPFNRVSVRDIATAAAKVCLDPTFPSGAYPLVGPESLDGEACARVWSEALGREVLYRVQDAAFERAVVRETCGKKANDLLSSYGAIRRIKLPTSKRDLARTTQLLGRPPTPYATYVQEKAQAWRTPTDAPL